MVSAVVLDNGKQPQHTANILHGYGVSFKVTFEGEFRRTKLGLGFWRNEKS
jgi:hypothetical protein